LLRILVTEKGCQWDHILAQAKFPFNNSVNKRIGKIPFKIVYRIHPKGIIVLRDHNQDEFRSVGVEYFSLEMKKLHDRFREQLQDSSLKYKNRVDQKRREIQFEVGDEVLAHFRKESFPGGTYNKLKMKKIGPCRILRKFTANAYEIGLPDNVGISPIFNVADLYPYRRDDAAEPNDQKEVQWEEKFPTVEKPEMEKIIEKRVGKNTKRKTYHEYLVKWKDHPMEDSS
jgi:hypothetical protein